MAESNNLQKMSRRKRAVLQSLCRKIELLKRCIPQQVPDINLEGKILQKDDNYIYVGQSRNMKNDMTKELTGRSPLRLKHMSSTRIYHHQWLMLVKIGASLKTWIFLSSHQKNYRAKNDENLTYTLSIEWRKKSKVKDIISKVYFSKKWLAGQQK